MLENTVPAPNGSRHVGRSACLAIWQGIASARDAWFELEGVTAFEEGALIFWRYRWAQDDDSSVRGVNIMRVRNGPIVEGLGYVKASPAASS